MMQRLIRWLGIVLIGGGLVGCGRGPEASPAPTATPVLFSQWAVSAKASSEFGFPDWSANRVVGEPEVTGCVDDSRSWASARGNGLEWLELTYARAIQVREVRIHQTLGRGAVARVRLLDEEGGEHLIWEGADVSEPCPGVLTVEVPLTSYRAQTVRIELDESRTGFWNQIDAVELVGEE